MISSPIFNFDAACAGVKYPIEEPPECAAAKTIQWLAIAPFPPGVTADDIIFSNPNGATSFVTFPVPGNYSVVVECCE